MSGGTRRGLRALLALVLGLLWFTQIGPAAGNKVRQLRAEAARALSVDEVRAALRASGTRPDAELEALLEEAEQAEAQETEWNLLVGALLDPDQRQRALELEPDLPPVPAQGDVRFVEPELPALAQTLLEAHGMAEVTLPALPASDPWPGVDRRRRARGILALEAAHELRGDQAQALLMLTLQAMRTQAARARIEKDLGEQLPPTVREAILEARLRAAPSF